MLQKRHSQRAYRERMRKKEEMLQEQVKELHFRIEELKALISYQSETNVSLNLKLKVLTRQIGVSLESPCAESPCGVVVFEPTYPLNGASF
jgi:regulator of replication initiation timing